MTNFLHLIARARSASAAASLCATLLLVTADARASESSAGERLNIAGSKIHYQTCGSGEPLVLLHDGLIGMSTWDGVWDSLCKQFRVVRYDRRGFGQSDRAMQRYSPATTFFS